MESMLTISGLNFEPYLAENGIKYTRNDVDGSDAGELEDGTMRRDRVIIRPTLEITLKDIDVDDNVGHLILQAIEPQWVNVSYYDLRLGKQVTRKFYSNNVSYSLRVKQNGKRYYRIAPFPLIAKGVAGDGREGVA